MGRPSEAAALLTRSFAEAREARTTAGAQVLKALGERASACIVGTSKAQDAVAFALSQVLLLHSEDRTDRVTTADDAYLLSAMADECFEEAVTFVAHSGSAEDAARIIAALARLTPNRLYGRWPP